MRFMAIIITVIICCWYFKPQPVILPPQIIKVEVPVIEKPLPEIKVEKVKEVENTVTIRPRIDNPADNGGVSIIGDGNKVHIGDVHNHIHNHVHIHQVRQMAKELPKTIAIQQKVAVKGMNSNVKCDQSLREHEARVAAWKSMVPK